MEITENTPLEQKTNPVVITVNRNLSGLRLRNFYLTNAFQGFVWMIFHFSMVFFFTFQLENVFLVGIFLGIANFIAFLLDIPIGILQKYYSTKKLFVIGAICQLIATFIFFNFIYEVFKEFGTIGQMIVPEGFESMIGWFFGSFFNWILLILASCCYGITKEINEISTYGYILSNVSPSEYSTVLARNNITYGIGSLSGLLISGIILSIHPAFAVISLATIIVFFLLFTTQFFDNSEKTFGMEDIVSFTVSVKKLSKEHIREYLVEKIQVTDLPKIMEQAKFIFYKPLTLESRKFVFKEFFDECKNTGKNIWSILGSKPPYILIYWTMMLVLLFGFWDTFAATFLIEYLDNIAPGWSYVLLACIALPALGLQEFTGKIAKKIGIKTVAFFGLFLSGSSLILLGFIGNDVSSGIVMLLAIINSIGYACGMALGQNGFLENYNKIYAVKSGLREIDANASAGPMKILQNLANVIGLILGGLILGILDYHGFFFIFGALIFILLIWSIKIRDKLDI